MSHYSSDTGSFDERALGEALRALPACRPPGDGWIKLQARMVHRQRRRRRAALAGTALAACLVLAVARPLPGPSPEPIIAQPAAHGEMARLMQQSMVLEQQLVAARPMVRRWSGAQALRAAHLQQRLSAVDYRLNFASADEATALWRERVELMHALVDLHERPAPMLVQAAYPY